MESTTDSKTGISIEKLEKACAVLKTIAHPVRMSIIELLEKNTRMNVGEMQEQLKIEQAALSHHLIAMKDKKILKCQREGKNMVYELKEKRIIKILECVAQCECD
ncbi:MAG: winged helix-turn-helix transcriptional regulator [Sporocytophaga sp.]|uniref:ArsR/SmtB family transcription factor n=1 Tax=Sporocytophaga sp. TaxID=2231183 RepID=UPI001B1DED4D|nr:metalloregulator ArsR/SmtB family transcription factor [Sporocytophaga sp.]MBO9701905.1 winged helix-turn-helix transcriptional regulator [Sporocytophaga sp.]